MTKTSMVPEVVSAALDIGHHATKHANGHLIGVVGGSCSGKTTFCSALESSDKGSVRVAYPGRTVRRMFRPGVDFEAPAPEMTESLVREIVFQAAASSKSHPLFVDGFPRTVEQADFAYEMMGGRFGVVVVLSTLEQRLRRSKARDTDWDRAVGRKRILNEYADWKPYILGVTMRATYFWEVFNGTVREV